jgi:IclR family KDG regulon transcriptional repressor
MYGGVILKEEYNFITMIERANDVLDLMFSTDRPLGVSEIAQELDLPKATVYRILITLAKGGFVIKKHGTEKYTLGGKFIKFSERVKHDINIHSIAKPYMEELASKSGEAVNLAIDYDNASLIIERAKGEHTALVSMLIPTAPYNCSSSGKIFLAYKSDKRIEDYFKKEKWEKRTVKSVTTLEEFIKQKKDIIRKGYSVDDEEYDYGLYCIGMPVFSCENKLLGVISITGPKSRFEFKGLNKIRENLENTVNNVNKEIIELGIKE